MSDFKLQKFINSPLPNTYFVHRIIFSIYREAGLNLKKNFHINGSKRNFSQHIEKKIK